jgi:hypothetical protein
MTDPVEYPAAAAIVDPVSRGETASAAGIVKETDA